MKFPNDILRRVRKTFAALSFAAAFATVPTLFADDAPTTEPAFPRERLERDWLYQDAGKLAVDDYFTSAENCDAEKKIVAKVLAELAENDVETADLQRRLDELATVPASDTRWKSLYLDACEARRTARLSYFDDAPREFVYAKHFVFGDCQAMFAMTDHLTDAIFREKGPDYRTGSQLRIFANRRKRRNVERTFARLSGRRRSRPKRFLGRKNARFFDAQKRRRRRFSSLHDEP